MENKKLVLVLVSISILASILVFALIAIVVKISSSGKVMVLIANKFVLIANNMSSSSSMTPFIKSK